MTIPSRDHRGTHFAEAEHRSRGTAIYLRVCSSGGGTRTHNLRINSLFRWDLDIRSTRSPIKVLIMTDANFACWYTHACNAHWRYWGPSRHITASWDAGRGCSGYVSVITSTGPTTVIPLETITQDPAHKGTGVCRA